ncbi:hypothetical protein, partial [Nostoc sp. NOS(2021)]|uniref:hypothetical protein n=1 Tax=Nostoc sp. NOS(2021) TaxID=2815407 RepID=UPI0025F8AB4D
RKEGNRCVLSYFKNQIRVLYDLDLCQAVLAQSSVTDKQRFGFDPRLLADINGIAVSLFIEQFTAFDYRLMTNDQ